MTYYPNTAVAELAAEPSHYMAVIDDLGREVPITEIDIRRSLKQLESAETNPNQHAEALNLLMDRVYAARAIA